MIYIGQRDQIAPDLDQIDHDLDHVVPHPPLREVVHDLHIAQIQPGKSVFRSCRLHDFHAKHELDYRSGTHLP